MFNIKGTKYCMKRITLLMAAMALLLATGKKASAQYYFYDSYSYNTPIMFELGGSVGIMNCLTDIGGKKGLGKKMAGDLNLGNNHLNGSIYLTATYKEAVALRLEGTWGSISAYDSILVNEKATTNGRYERNLNFRSKISEVALIAEFHPLFMFINWSLRDDKDPPRISPYLAAGIGWYSFNPQAKSRTGEYVDLQPLSTEGQGFPDYPERKTYKLNQFNVPLGIGVRYELSSSFNLRAELLHRTLFTDYLDDVSTNYIYKVDNDPTLTQNAWYENGFTGQQLQDAYDLASNQRTNTGSNSSIFRKSENGIRGNPKNKDSYFTFNIKIGLLIGREHK
jgi:hypothetical protein